MSVEAISVVLHHSRAKGTEKLVLVGIANHSGDGGAWPTIATLARYANVHERNVQRAVERLVALGELGVLPQAGGHDSRPRWERPNRYEVLVSCPVTCDRTVHHRIVPLPGDPGLWIDRVALAPPGGAGATGGVALAPPGGVALAPPKPSLEPSTTGSRSVTGPRASARPCSTCGQTEAECTRRAAVNGHRFAPQQDAS